MRFFDNAETHLETYRRFKSFAVYLRDFEAEFHVKPVNMVHQCLLHKFDKMNPIASQEDVPRANAESARNLLEQIHKRISELLIDPKLSFLNPNNTINVKWFNTFLNMHTISDRKKYLVIFNFINRKMNTGQLLLNALGLKIRRNPDMLRQEEPDAPTMPEDQIAEDDFEEFIASDKNEEEEAAPPHEYTGVPQLLEKYPNKAYEQIAFAEMYTSVRQLIEEAAAALPDNEKDQRRREACRVQLRNKLASNKMAIKTLIFTFELLDLVFREKSKGYAIVFVLREAARLPSNKQ